MTGDSEEERVRRRAREMLTGAEGNADAAGDKSSARRAARGILEESAERVNDAAVTDPDDEDVIRRGSEETAVDPGS